MSVNHAFSEFYVHAVIAYISVCEPSKQDLHLGCGLLLSKPLLCLNALYHRVKPQTKTTKFYQVIPLSPLPLLSI